MVPALKRVADSFLWFGVILMAVSPFAIAGLMLFYREAGLASVVFGFGLLQLVAVVATASHLRCFDRRRPPFAAIREPAE